MDQIKPNLMDACSDEFDKEESKCTPYTFHYPTTLQFDVYFLSIWRRQFILSILKV